MSHCTGWQLEWNGAWSDKDTRNWTPALKTEMNFTDEDDGTFFMSISDFMKRFTTLTYVDLSAAARRSVLKRKRAGAQNLLRLSCRRILERAVCRRVCELPDLGEQPADPYDDQGSHRHVLPAVFAVVLRFDVQVVRFEDAFLPLRFPKADLSW
eukprot:313668-Rhodomonas_salina.2